MITASHGNYFEGLSSDVKPTRGDIPKGSLFLEIDTQALYCWNSKCWTLQDTLNRMIEEEIKDAKKLINDVPEISIDSIPKPLLCPNCGAPLHGHICEYCDTEFIRTPEESMAQIKLHLFEEQRKVEELYQSAIKAFRHYHI
jgi:hypothetical protein